MVAALVYSSEIKNKKEEEKERLDNDEKNKANKRYSEYGCPQNSNQFTYLSGLPGITETYSIFVWRDNCFLNFLIDSSLVHKIQIPLTDIRYFSLKGDLRQETELIGEIRRMTTGEFVIAEGLFGAAATINRNNQTISNIKNIDERKTIINATINGKDRFIVFETGALYNYLLEQIPEKEQLFVNMQTKS